ncbi:ABC transporter ATP-binding protein [Phenylobacterium deserti]|uniref:Sugar ABC transporter ATP-binding protein n=1 Tax=Phenylobacterium deserti TaxID=1914756 RepID=A0A328AUL8_9CAUL|nr:ATP-binding cassette domain-containing protein [Phenylobacterium deserti]RAK57861.1 sugar ABC transporter ATP-binding protein [Phenylobacterium deserti]
MIKKAPPVSISCRDLTLRFPVYGVDAKSLKKSLAAVTVGGRLGTHAHVTEVTALNHVNLELKPGDRLGLVGHNGSGKTTLLRALSGAYEPDEGAIEVQGRIAALLDLSLGIDPSATGLDNIRLRGRIAGLSSREIEARMDEIASFTGLGPFLAMPVKTYSAGMQARLAFAAATAVEADVLLMDEWIAVGDSDFQKLAHKRLLKLVERAGILVLASHDTDLLRLYCNKVMRLEGGVASAVTDIRKLDELMAA